MTAMLLEVALQFHNKPLMKGISIPNCVSDFLLKHFLKFGFDTRIMNIHQKWKLAHIITRNQPVLHPGFYYIIYERQIPIYGFRSVFTLALSSTGLYQRREFVSNLKNRSSFAFGEILTYRNFRRVPFVIGYWTRFGQFARMFWRFSECIVDYVGLP